MSQLSLFTDGPVLGPEFPLPLDQTFTTRAAQGAGVTRRTLATLVDDGYIRRLLRGVFVASHVPDSLLLRAHALRLVVPTDVVVVDWTAAWLFTGMLPFGHHLSVPPVALFRPSGHGRLRNDLSVSGERHFQ